MFETLILLVLSLAGLAYAVLSSAVIPGNERAVRRIVNETSARDYRWSDIVLAVVKSVSFQMRRTPQS